MSYLFAAAVGWSLAYGALYEATLLALTGLGVLYLERRSND